MTAERNRANCDDCGDELDVTEPGIGEWVTGFVVNRSGFSRTAYNGISCHTGTGRYLCRVCVRNRRSGGSPEQTRMFS